MIDKFWCVFYASQCLMYTRLVIIYTYKCKKLISLKLSVRTT